MNRPFLPSARIEAPPQGFTADDFWHMVECGAFQDMKVELSGGFLERMAPSRLEHSALHADVIVDLGMVARSAKLRITTDLAVQIDDLTVRAPDVALLRDTSEEGLVPAGDVLLAIEISDATLGRDIGPKLRDYARSGIPTYWVVDVNARIVRVMTDPEGEDYRRVEIVRFGEPLAVPGTEATITIA